MRRTTTRWVLIADELLLGCFFLSAIAYFCAFEGQTQILTDRFKGLSLLLVVAPPRNLGSRSMAPCGNGCGRKPDERVNPAAPSWIASRCEPVIGVDLDRPARSGELGLENSAGMQTYSRSHFVRVKRSAFTLLQISIATILRQEV